MLVIPRIQVAYQEAGNRSPTILVNEGDIFVRRGAQSIKADQYKIFELLEKQSHPNETDQKGSIRKQWRSLETLNYPVLSDTDYSRSSFTNHSSHDVLSRDHYFIFISYSRSDGRTEADHLYDALNRHGIPAWLDERNIKVGQDFTADIEKNIIRASHVIVCVTPDSTREDSFVRREINYSLQIKKPIIPLRFADLPVHININTFPWIDFFSFSDWNDAFEKLLRWLEQPFVELPTQQNDPLHEHLERLNQYIIKELQRTVLNDLEILQLHSVDTSDAVAKTIAIAYISRGPTFFSKAKNKPKEFDNFPQAFEYHHKHVLLLGEPGAGKSTTLLAFARDKVNERLSDRNALLPVYAPIHTWKGNEPLVNWLARVTALDLDQLRQEIATDRVLLMLDGLDELRSFVTTPIDPAVAPHNYRVEDYRFEFMQKLIEISHTPTLVTCRVKDYDDIVLKGGEKIALKGALMLKPLTDSQIKTYLNDQANLWKVIQADNALRDMVRTPLLLTLLASAYQDAGDTVLELQDLSSDPGELRDKIFDVYVQKRYEFEAAHTDEPLSYTLKQIYDVLGRAMTMALGEDQLKDYNTIEVSIFRRILGEQARDFLDLAQRLHLLLPARELIYRFVHFRFTHLLLRDHFTFSYCMAHLNDHNIQNQVVRALGRIGDKRAIEVLITALSKKDRQIRLQAAKALGEIGDVRAVELLIAAIDDEDKEIQANAVTMLSHIDDSRALQAIIATQYNENVDDMIRIWSTIMLIAMKDRGDKQAYEALISGMLDGNEVVLQLASFIGFQDKRVTRALIAAMQKGNEPVRRAAAEGLGRSKDQEAIEPLIAALGDEDQSVRNAAGTALLNIGESIVEPLTIALKNDNELMRSIALELLGYFKNERVLQLIINALREGNYEVRLSAARALIHIGSPAIKSVVELLREEDMELQALAALILTNIGESGIESLTEALRDENEMVQFIAKQVLVHMGKSAVEPLIEVLRTGDAVAKAIAAEALGEIKEEHAIELLMIALNDSDIRVREAVRAALKNLGCDSDHSQITMVSNGKNNKPYIQIINSESKSVREQVETVAANMSKSTPELLIAALNYEDRDVRYISYIALLYLGEIAIEQLLDALHNENQELHGQVLGVIAMLLMMKGPAAEALFSALSTQSEQIQRIVAEKLDVVSDPEVVSFFTTDIRSMQDKQREIRKKADEISSISPIDQLMIEQLTHKNNKLRIIATEVLGQERSKASVKLLISVLSTKNEQLVMRAALALGRIGDVIAIEPLMITLNNADARVRYSAALALKDLEGNINTHTEEKLHE